MLALMMIERLEQRALLDAVLVGGTLTVTGTARSDGIRVHDVGTNLVVRIGDAPEQSFAIRRVKHLVVHGGKGNDHIIVGFKTIGLGASIFGDDGNDTLEGTAASDDVRSTVSRHCGSAAFPHGSAAETSWDEANA